MFQQTWILLLLAVLLLLLLSSCFLQKTVVKTCYETSNFNELHQLLMHKILLVALMMLSCTAFYFFFAQQLNYTREAHHFLGDFDTYIFRLPIVLAETAL